MVVVTIPHNQDKPANMALIVFGEISILSKIEGAPAEVGLCDSAREFLEA